MFRSDYISRRLANASPTVFIAVTGLFSFMAYCCIYAFRKPFTAGSYADLELWGIRFKIVLVLAQVMGYALSKFIGIRIISGLTAARRSTMLLLMVGVAGLSLLGFAITPFPWNALWMFVNGLPLGMAWGLVFGYLEGRRVTEALAAILCVNFIISSGFVKTAGLWLISSQGVSEYWMPLLVALLFLPVLLLCIWALEHLPPPTEADRAQRTPRISMTSRQRKTLFLRYAPGLILLVGAYLVLTILRDIRDNFAVEIWDELGYHGQASILTTAEAPVAFFSLVAVGALMFVKDNFRAFWLHHALSLAGIGLLAGGTFLFLKGEISPLVWMISSGMGMFLPYILFNGVIFDRLMAGFREEGNVGFLMYLADSIGYLGSVAVLLWRNFGDGGMSWVGFYTKSCFIGAALCAFFLILSWYYFFRKRSIHSSQQSALKTT